MTAAVAPVAAAPASPAPTTGAAAPTPTNGDAAPKPVDGAASPKPAAKPLTEAQKIKLRLQGKKGVQEREYTPAELERELQIAEHERTQRAQFLEERKAYDARMKKLAESPDEFFQEAGIDVEQILAQRQQRAEQMKALSPEQQENLRLKEQLTKLETAQQRAAEEAKSAQEQREHHEFVQANVARLGKAIELSGLPRSGELVRLYAEVQEMAAHAGEPEMTPEQLHVAGERLMSKRMATLLKAASNEGWRQRNGAALAELAKAVLPALEGDALLDWVGKENAMRVVKALHAKTRTSPVPIVQEPPPVAQSNGAPRPGAPTRDEWDVLDSLTG